MKYLVFNFVLLLVFWLVYTLAMVPCRRPFDRSLLSMDMSAVCKGIAMLAIMTGHIGNLYGVRYLTPLGSFGVGVFLFFSGYGLELSTHKHGLRGFWRRRLIGVYIPYVLVELVSYFFIFETVTFKGVVGDLTLAAPLHALGWYMRCLLLYYVAFYIGAWVEQRYQCTKLIAVGLAALLMFLFMPGLYKEQALSFVLGAFFAKSGETGKRVLSSKTVGFFVLLLGVLALALRQIDAVRQLPWPIYALVRIGQVTGLALGVIILGNILFRWLHSAGLMFMRDVGMISYELYLLHMLFKPHTLSYWGIVVFFAASIGASAVFYWLRSWCTQRFVRSRHAVAA